MTQDNQDNKLDLFLNVLNNPDKNFEDLINAGFTVDNSKLHSKEIYQNDAEIKDRYTNSNGVFDQARFNKDYEIVSQVQQNLQNIKDYDKQIDFFSYHRNNFLVDENKRRKGYDFEIFKIPNPFEQTSGIVQLGKTENPTKTAAEIAQGEQVHNLKTNKWEQSPEDASFFGNIFDETKVLAVYEEDGTHEDSITGEIVAHKQGDLKFNSNGKPYYETLNGRDVYGRQVLSNFDVLTKENSNWNRYDFFDNDGYDKSVVGSLVKTVAVVAPMFISYVGPVYTGASVLVNALGLFGTLGKIVNINDWMDPDTAKWFNNLEGWSKSMNTLDSRSEYAKQHTWSLENMIGMIGDAISQLKEQRWIFEYGPLFFNPNWEATKAIASKKGVNFEKLEQNFAKKLQGSKFDELLTSTGKNAKNPVMDAASVLQLQAKKQAEDYFTQSQKVSEILSKLYMTGITTQDGYSEAKAAGADDVTAALYALGYAAGEYAIINSRLGDWILPEKRIASAIDKKTASTLFSSLVKSKPAQTASKVEKSKWIQKVFNSAKEKLNKDYIVGFKSQTQTIMDNMLAGALAESLEEVSEEFWTDISKSLYNTVQYFRGEEETSMKAWDNALDRYLMSAVGGAVGGGVTALDLDVTKQLNKDMTFNEAAQRVITMVRNNDKNHEFDQFLQTVSKMDFGNTEIVNGKSGNDLIISSLKQFQNFVYDVINAENANLSDDHILNKVSKELREEFKWSQLMSPLYKENVNEEDKTGITPIENSIIGAKILQDVNSDLAIILGNTAASQAEENEKTDLEKRNEEKTPKKEKKNIDDSKVEDARKHLQNTLNGSLNYEYAQLFLYEYTHMGDRLIPSTFRAFVKMTTGKHLEEFDEEQKTKLKEKYEATKKNRADLLMFLANSHQQISELSKETVEKLADVYKQNAENKKLKHLTKFLEKLVTFDENVISDDMFLERFSQLYDNLETWKSQVYTSEGEKVFNSDGSEKTQTLGLYTALNSAFGIEDDYKSPITIFNVDPIQENDTLEIQEQKKQLMDYNDQLVKYTQFIQAIKQLNRLVEFYENQGFINSELKQTLYHLTDKLNKNRTKIELLSNRYSDILKNITKQYFTLEESSENFYTLINSLFPGKNFTTPEEFQTYIETEAKDTLIGKEILQLIESGIDLSDLETAFQYIASNVSGLEGVLNYDKITNRDYVDKSLLDFNEKLDGTQREHIYNQKIEEIEKLQEELQSSLQLTEQTRTRLNNLAHTQIEEDLNQFAFSIGEEAIFTNLLASLNEHLFQNRNSIDSIMLNDTLSKRIDDALWLISMYEDTLNTARTVLYDTTNVWGYNKTLNSIAKKVKTDKKLPTLAEIDSETADVFLQDLNLYKKKLIFLKKLYSVNAGQKFAVNDRVELNTSYIFLSKLKKWIGSLEPHQSVEGLDELQKVINSITILDKFYDGKDKNFNLSQEDKINMVKERIKVEDALYTFFNKNINNLTYENLKKLFINDAFTISDLFKSKPTIINEKTEDISFLEFINYFATRAAIKSSTLRYEVATVIQDEISSKSTKKIVPIPTQVEAVFYPYAKFANPKMVQKFTDFKRKLLEEYVNNITKEQLTELYNLGLAPFKKGSLDESNIEQALTIFKENIYSLSAYPEFEDVISLVEGMPGTGKSFGVDDLIAKMLNKHHKEYLNDAIVINTTSETAENLAKALNLKKFYTIEEFLTQTMNNHTEVGLTADGELNAIEGTHYKVINGTQIDAIAEPKEGLTLPQIIFVDELPTLNRIQILELSKLARKYNIEILATGDYNQTTPNGKIKINDNIRYLAVNRSNYFSSTKLGVSMRTDNNQKTNNINQTQIAVETAQYESDTDIDLTLTYMQDEQGIFGDKVVFTSNTDITDDQLQEILKDIDIMIKTLKKDKNGVSQKINYIFSNSKSKLYTTLSKDDKYKEYIQFHVGNTSQGKEGQYWIVENDREASNLSTYLQELYTGISRSEQGSIIIASSQYSGNLAKLTLKNTQTQVRINEGFSEEIKQKQLEKLIKFYKDLTLEEAIVSIVRNKPTNLKNLLIEELRKEEADASLTGEIIYYSIKSEDPLVIKIGDEEIPITKDELIIKIKTENYRLTENADTKEPNSFNEDVTDDESNKGLTDSLNEELSKKHTESLQRIESQESQPIINFYQYLYSAFSMETSVEIDNNNKIIFDNDEHLSTDPLDSRIDNIIGLYKYFNDNDYHTLHNKLNQLRLAFLTTNDKTSLYNKIYNILNISEDQRKDFYIVFGYKKTNATVKEDGNREQMEIYAKANKTNKEIIEYNAQGGERSNEVGVNNLVVNIGFDSTGDFLEIPLMRFASPISIMYQTDKDGKFLFQELIDFWNSEELKGKTTYKKCQDLIEKFKDNKKYERIIREFQFYILPNSNYFSISAINEEWLPAKNLINLGPQVITNAGQEFYNETGFEFNNGDDNSWIEISKFRETYKNIMQASYVKMFTSETIRGIDISKHVKVGYPFILTKLGEPNNDPDITDDKLLEEFLNDIKEGNPSSQIRVVYLAKPKIALDSYLKKVFNFIFNGGKSNNNQSEFGNIFTTYKILEALFRDFDKNEEIKKLLNPNSKKTKAIKRLIEEVNSIKSDKSTSYTKDEIDQILKILKEQFNIINQSRDAELITEGASISVKTLFDSYLANLLKENSDKIDENKLNTIVNSVIANNPSLQNIYADGIAFKSVDGVATLQDSYLLKSGDDSNLNSEEFFIHAKVTLPMFFNNGIDFVQKFMDEFLVGGKYSKHNYSYFGIQSKKGNNGKSQIVKTEKYGKYGKSKIESKSKPGSVVETSSIEDLLTDINNVFNEFENTNKDINAAENLHINILHILEKIEKIDKNFNINEIAFRIVKTLLTNGIYVINDHNNNIKYYDFKTKPYDRYGTFKEFILDDPTKNGTVIFEFNGKLIEYLPIILSDGNLDLQRTTPDPEINIFDNVNIYKKELDELISGEIFTNYILLVDDSVKQLFSKKFPDSNKSFYDFLLSVNPLQRNSYLKIIKNAINTINNSNINSEFKNKAINLLDNFITPPKC